MFENLARMADPILNVDIVKRTRRNHGLEHATVHVLNKPISGRSDAEGFWLMGDVETGEVETAAHEALRRMRGGEHQLALHPNCGTNLLTTATMASLAALVGSIGTKRGAADLFGRLPTIVLLTVGAIVISEPVGMNLQKYFTTLGDPGNLEITGVRRQNMNNPLGGPITLHRVTTISS